MSPRRDAVPDDARPPPRSPNVSRRVSTPRRWALGNRSGPGMTLAAAAPTTNGSGSLATDTSGIAIPSQGRKECKSSNPEPDPGLVPEDRNACSGPCIRRQALELVNNETVREVRMLKIVLDGGRPITEGPESEGRKGRCGAGLGTIACARRSLQRLADSGAGPGGNRRGIARYPTPDGPWRALSTERTATFRRQGASGGGKARRAAPHAVRCRRHSAAGRPRLCAASFPPCTVSACGAATASGPRRPVSPPARRSRRAP